jgi:hypothetical protein
MTRHSILWFCTLLTLTACGGNKDGHSSAATSSANSSTTISANSSTSNSGSINSSAANSSSDDNSSANFALNDTGTTYCRDSAGNDADCLIAPPQDGNSGRDNQTLNKQGAGPAGFDWSKRAHDGSLITDQQQAWQNTGSETASTQWSCVQDHQAGLWWEVKSDVIGSINHRDLRYSWLNDDTNSNGGITGSTSSDDCNGSLCDTQSYMAALNALHFCGRDNWRLPSLNELLSLVVTDNLDLVMDTAYFPNAHNDQYWTYQSYAPDRNKAWYLYFSDGSFGSTLKSSPNYLRLVSDTRHD